MRPSQWSPLIFKTFGNQTLGRSLVFWGPSSRWSRGTVKMTRFEAAQGPRNPCCQSIWGSLAAFFVISSLFSLLSFLCSLPSSLPGADPFRYHPALLGPNLCVLPPSHLDRACFSLLASLFSLLSSRFSLLSALFPLLSLLLISQIALRTCHFELCIRPSNPLPTASTLCVTIPGPAECAKRLNPATEPSGRR